MSGQHYYEKHFQVAKHPVIIYRHFLEHVESTDMSKMFWARLFKTNDVVNILLNFQKLISKICQYFLLKKVRSSHFFNKKFQ